MTSRAEKLGLKRGPETTEAYRKLMKRHREEWLANDPAPEFKPPPIDDDPDADRPTLGATTLEAMLVAIANGEPKPDNLSPDELKMWRDLAKEVREIRASGGEIDIPFESVGVE